jgi:ferredoxin-NADP reductase
MKFETRIKNVVGRTNFVKSFRFDRPINLDFRPGQFMFVTIKIGQEKTRKPFSISSSPSEKGYIELTKKMTGHEFSNALNCLRKDEVVTIEAPYGRFTFEGEYEKIAMLSGGVGITPLRSICKYCTDMLLNTEITLLYGNRTEKDIIFREDFTEMQKQNRNLKLVYTLEKPCESWTGYKGYINSEMIRKEIPDYLERVFYTCGPPAMVGAMESLLKELGLPKKQTKKEIFFGY